MPQRTFKGRVEIGGVYLPLSWSAHHNFVRDGTGRYSERGRACTVPPLSWAYFFSIMMECTPEGRRCHSVYSVVDAACPDGPHHLARSGADLRTSISKSTHNTVMSYVTQGRHIAGYSRGLGSAHCATTPFLSCYSYSDCSCQNIFMIKMYAQKISH
jgi:hypothetical protein